jgi:tetratricopeptide (TPR) repeat protein
MYHFSQVRALLPELPEDDEAAALGLRACTELLNMSWRVGIEPEESLALRDEGQRLATRLGDSQAHAKLAMIYGRARCAEGDVQAYVDASFEFQRVTVDLDHVPSQANAWMYLGDSLGFATRLPEALQFNEEGLERFPRLIPREEWMIGVAPHSVYALWRAYCLAWMGRLDEAVEQIDYGWRAAKADDLPEMVAYCHSFATEVHFLRGDADPTLSHALQVEELCRRLGNHSVMNAHANRSVAYAHLAAGRPADAIEPAREALEIFSQTEKPHAAMAAYLLAEALLETGDLEAAESAADDAISRAAQSLRGNFEALAHSVLARLRLRRDGSAATELAAASLVVANDLLEKTSATTLRPFLQQNQAELAGVLGESAERARLLREAQSGFEAIGAPLRAGRAGE